jgi:hypothetical protein
MQAVYVRINPGSVLNIVDNHTEQSLMPLSIQRRSFIASVNSFPYRNSIYSLRELASNATIINEVDLASRRYVWLVLDDSVCVDKTGVIGVCGDWDKQMSMYGLGFFLTKFVQNE